MKRPVTALSRWFIQAQRAMPWRQTRDPYSIWISEVMLQQTQVTTVLPYYERFLARFPTVQALAEAPESDVLALWSGLGYYSRARNLHRGAKYVAGELGGKFPRTREEILKIPGIGPYTAGAILSIAFDLPVPLVDGNVQRVLSRYHGWTERLESSASKAFFWEKAELWVKAAESPRVLNQALMELGAVICTKGTPRCGGCPLASTCVAHAKGIEADLPRRKPRREKVDVHWIGLVLEHRGKIYLRPNPAAEWWSGLWDFPRVELSRARDLGRELQGIGRHWKTEAVALGAQKHTVTHHRLSVTPAVLRLDRAPRAWPEQYQGGRWVSPDELDRIPISSLAKKIARAWRRDSENLQPRLC